MRVLVYGASGECYGGIESFLLNMNQHMSKDCIFDYVIVGEECIHTSRMEAQGGTVYYVTSYKKNPFRFLQESWKLAKSARTTHTIAYFNLFSMCHITSVLFSKVFGYRIVLHAHNNNVSNKSRLYHGLHWLGSRVLSKMDCLRLTNSEASGVFMYGGKFNGEQSAKLIYNAVEVPKYLFCTETREQKRRELGIHEERVIGFAGRIAVEKNLFFLLEVFSEIYKKDKNTAFVIAGDGELRTTLMEKAAKMGLAEQVKFLGREMDMPALYQALDAFVLPSLFEGLGIVLIEAQASGLPCFASADVIPEIARIAEAGLQFIPLEEPSKNWAQRILCGINTTQERTLWNKLVAQSRYNINQEAVHLEKLLKEAANEG